MIIDLERLDIPNNKTAGSGDYWKISPKGYVPALMLDDGQILTEVGVISQYLADQKPASSLIFGLASNERYFHMVALNLATAEIHKQVGALFSHAMMPETKEVQIETMG